MSKMNIAYSALEDIHGYERNARNHPELQIKQIIKSITEFGFNNPILIDKHGEHQAIMSPDVFEQVQDALT